MTLPGFGRRPVLTDGQPRGEPEAVFRGLIVIVVIIFGVASHSRECHGLTPESDGPTAVTTHNNHYESINLSG